MSDKKYSGLYTVLSAVFVSAMLISNIIGVKQIEAAGFLRFSGGVLVFPITYMLSDIFSEVYGYKTSRNISWITFLTTFFMVIIFQLAIILPCPVRQAEWNEAFKLTLSSTPRICAAGLAAFQIGDWVNDAVFQKMRSLHGGRFFSLRAVVSSVAGETVDSSLFAVTGFIGTMPLSALPQMIVTMTAMKLLYEIIFLPVTILAVKKIRRYEGPEAYSPAASYGLFG